MADRMLGVAVRIIGDNYVYSPLAGGSFPIDAVFSDTFESLDPETGVTVLSQQPNLGIRSSSLANPPVQGDTVVVNGVTYQVVSPMPDGVAGFHCLLHKV